MFSKPLGTFKPANYVCGQHSVTLPEKDGIPLEVRQTELESRVIASRQNSDDYYTRAYLGHGIQIGVLDRRDSAIKQILKQYLRSEYPNTPFKDLYTYQPTPVYE